MKILFVCTGNTCRSPMAEGIFRKMMQERGMEDKVLCQSAGLSAVDGDPVSENAVLACREIGVEPKDCVSVADNIKRDIAGAKKAGIGCNIIFRSPEKKHPVEFTEENRPDYVVEDFREILNILT